MGTEALFPYYERELIYIRQIAQEFAQKYPAAAGRLMIEANRSSDPHIERLIESFAFLAGRVRHKLDDEFPELTDALLSVIAPHYLRPIPSMAIAQFVIDPSRGALPEGFDIPPKSELRSPRVGDVACRYRTVYPTKLWPLEIRKARLQAPPYPTDFRAPRRTESAIRLEIGCRSQVSLEELELETLRMFLFGSGFATAELYELIFNHCTEVLFRVPGEGKSAHNIRFSPKECLSQVGFDLDQSLLPYDRRTLPGYRLLTEFFAFPEKFLFADLGCWQKVCKSGNYGRSVEVVFFLNRHASSLEEWLDEDTFQLGCTPIINLFRQVAEPIRLTQRKFEYPVIPDVNRRMGMEVYSIEDVRSINADSDKTTVYEPFYSFRSAKPRQGKEVFWHASREPSNRANDFGTEVSIRLVDRNLDLKLPADHTLVVQTTCTNRNLPTQLRRAGQNLRFDYAGAAPITGVRCLVTPSPPLHPPVKRGSHWGLVSHLLLNHLSITDPAEGREAFQEILRLYDFSDPEAGQGQMSEVNRQLVEGILEVESRRVVGRTGGTPAGFCRGVEVSMMFDEEKYIGTGVFLFASVLERFLGLYASINSFTQLVAKTRQREGTLKKWPPRVADRPLL
ncbi:Type VI secretion system baseplate subunit TssF [Planctomycetales bacterium 10988]|nr:Type VI secretion system baseplate subunit TssF [Planctomycetales bacterium 10988]